jgi:hypothetical protein
MSLHTGTTLHFMRIEDYMSNNSLELGTQLIHLQGLKRTLLSTISDLPNSCSVFHADSCNHDQQHLLFKAGTLAYIGTF